MNNRLTIQDLAGILAEHSGKDRTSTEQFLKVFITVVTEGVYADKIVKIKGLGTFKVIPVEPRESIHVNTGERFIIPKHYKFSFLPDKELKELVNKPFSFFETTEVSEDADFADMDVSEESDPEGKESEYESVEEVMPDKEVPVVSKPFSPAEESVQAPDPDPEIPEALHTEQLLPIEDVADKQIHRPLKAAAVIAVSLVAAISIALYLNRDIFTSLVRPSVEVQQNVPETPLQPVDTLEEMEVIEPDSAIVVVAKDSVPSIQPPSGILAKVKIKPGSRLTLISLDYYGSKLFWVYIYEHNKAKIKDPNNVPVGTELEIPAPALYGINARDRASIEKAAALQTEILQGGQ